MTPDPRTGLWVGDPGIDSRDFDYGVGDDLRAAQRRTSAEIAARIRQAARLDPTGTPRERQVYEVAARIAEGVG